MSGWIQKEEVPISRLLWTQFSHVLKLPREACVNLGWVLLFPIRHIRCIIFSPSCNMWPILLCFMGFPGKVRCCKILLFLYVFHQFPLRFPYGFSIISSCFPMIPHVFLWVPGWFPVHSLGSHFRFYAFSWCLLGFAWQ